MRIPRLNNIGKLLDSLIINPVFRRSTMKIPTFSNFLIRLKSLIYPEKLDFIAKFNVLTGHFFIEIFFDILYNNSTT